MGEDWLLAIGITFMLVLFILALLMLAGVFRRRPGDEAGEERMQRWEARCRKRMLELEQKHAQLERLIGIADEKILQLEDLNMQAETQRLTVIGRGGGRSGDLQKMVDETFNREFKEKVRQFQLQMEDRFHAMQRRPVRRPAIEEDDGIEDLTTPERPPSSSAPDHGQTAVSNSVFPAYVPGNYQPDQDDDHYMQERFDRILHLSETGLSSEEISNIVRMEKSTVDMILGLSGQSGKQVRG